MVALMLSMTKLFWNDENPILKNTIVKNRISLKSSYLKFIFI